MHTFMKAATLKNIEQFIDQITKGFVIILAGSPVILLSAAGNNDRYSFTYAKLDSTCRNLVGRVAEYIKSEDGDYTYGGLYRVGGGEWQQAEAWEWKGVEAVSLKQAVFLAGFMQNDVNDFFTYCAA